MFDADVLLYTLVSTWCLFVVLTIIFGTMAKVLYQVKEANEQRYDSNWRGWIEQRSSLEREVAALKAQLRQENK